VSDIFVGENFAGDFKVSFVPNLVIEPANGRLILLLGHMQTSPTLPHSSGAERAVVFPRIPVIKD
jgi:hypothetical protein